MPPKKLVLGSGQRTHPLVWCLAIICVIIAIAVIIAGIIIFVGYLIIHPRVPSLTVTGAHLDRLDYSQAARLDAQISINIRAENRNAKAHATFSDTIFTLSFHGIPIAKLVAYPFEVPKNNSLDLPYVVESTSIPLGPAEMEIVDNSLKKDRIKFDLKGSSRTQWRVGILGSVKFWCHLNCDLEFHPSNSSYISSYCSSRTK